MDIKSSINKAGSKQTENAAQEFLEKFLSPAFGALPKSEIELLVFNFLENIGAVSSDPNEYELVSKLKVTRSKARKLIYERELRRLTSTDLDTRVKRLIERPIIQKSGELFILEVENPLVSDHIRNKIRELGYISDGSFSPSIVKLPLKAVIALIEHYLSDTEKDKIKKDLVKAGAPDTTFKGVLKSVLKKVGSKIAEETGEALIDNASEYLSPIMNGTIKGGLSKFKDLYSTETKKGG